MTAPKATATMTCPHCGANIRDVQPIKLDGSCILTYESDDGHTLRFDGGDVSVSKCPDLWLAVNCENEAR
jgi:hypothetical protein